MVEDSCIAPPNAFSLVSEEESHCETWISPLHLLLFPQCWDFP